ncbi:hypothetical protein OUZ56_001922 [Daphnia magna]|uniref:Uncharacterized protein n=1 Tax=Daphnia magna TaxID=35525 RepID=A0ABR0A455_9CRUS|nr:hypothetical protein OUZ56_001922 [Daphnia magna]
MNEWNYYAIITLAQHGTRYFSKDIGTVSFNYVHLDRKSLVKGRHTVEIEPNLETRDNLSTNT